MKGNTLAWARLWVQRGAPDLKTPPFDQEHHTITAKLAPFRKLYLEAETDEEREAICEEYLDP